MRWTWLRWRRLWVTACLLASCVLTGCMPRPSTDAPVPPAQMPGCGPEEAAFVYRQRIEPLIQDERPASCNRCHLKGIDLSAFVRADACQSMACLIEKDMVDLEHPRQSGILALIDRARGGPTPAIAEAEYEGFLAWIEYSARCHAQACEPMVNACHPVETAADHGAPDMGDAGSLDAGPIDASPPDMRALDAAPPDLGDASPPDIRLSDASLDATPDANRDAEISRELPGFSRDLRPCSPDALTLHFQARVMRWRRRCHHCHADDGITAGIRGAPLWMVDGGDYESARQTAERLLAAGYVDFEAPDQSLILLKPLTRRAGGIEHGGGNKFTRLTDPAYLDFLSWVERIAGCGMPDLSVVAPPPDAAREDMGVPDAAVDAAPDADRPRPLSDYCACMLDRCHDTFHRLWGEDDGTARVVCLQRAARLSAETLACRAAVCQAAPVLPDNAEDATLCAGAVGDGLCAE